MIVFFFSSRRRHTRLQGDWSSDVCSSDLAYTLLCNHVPLNGYLIGAHDYEAHHVFDIWYRNTSDIVPTAITGDMHSVNKANFAILHWFGLRFEQIGRASCRERV